MSGFFSTNEGTNKTKKEQKPDMKENTVGRIMNQNRKLKKTCDITSDIVKTRSVDLYMFVSSPLNQKHSTRTKGVKLPFGR